MAQTEIVLNVKEALRYFRAAPGDVKAQTLITQVYEELKTELQPRYTVKKFGCRLYAERETQRPAATVLSNGTLFYSRDLARYLSGCRELYLFAATLGSRVDIALRRLTFTGVAQGAAAQAVAAALIESYCDACCRELAEQLPRGKTLKPRFSPGYGDWKLEEQRLLFPVLDCARTIGLTLTESCMMAPVKSVTAVMGIAEQQEPLSEPMDGYFANSACAMAEQPALLSDDRPLHDRCGLCGKTDCTFRR